MLTVTGYDATMNLTNTRDVNIKSKSAMNVINERDVFHGCYIVTSALVTHTYLIIFMYTRAHLNKFINLLARLHCYYHSFFPHAIRLWNSLPNDLVTDTDLNSFSYVNLIMYT